MRQTAELLYTTDTTMQNEPDNFQVTLHYVGEKRLLETSEEMFIYPPYENYVINIVSGNEIDVTLTESELDLPGHVVLLLANTPAPWQDPEIESEEVPDVFAPSYQRKVLFSEQIEIQAGTLRRWKPHITIDPDMISEEEDD